MKKLSKQGVLCRNNLLKKAIAEYGPELVYHWLAKPELLSLINAMAELMAEEKERDESRAKT